MPVVNLQKVELTDGLDTFVEKVNLLLENFGDLVSQLKIKRESFEVTASSQSTFTLAEAPDSETIIIAVDGILIEETDYTVSNKDIVLDEPALQDQVVKVFYQIEI